MKVMSSDLTIFFQVSGNDNECDYRAEWNIWLLTYIYFYITYNENDLLLLLCRE